MGFLRMKDASVELTDFFVGGGPYGRTPSQQRCFVIVEERGRSGTVLSRCRAAIATVASGGYVAVVVRLDRLGALSRLVDFLMLPFRLARVSRAIADSGASPAGLFGIVPNVGQPTIVFPLRGAAAIYAQSKLLSIPSRPRAVGCRILAWWAGCDVSIGALLVVGRRP